MAWFDKVKTCFGWNLADQARIAQLRRCLDSDLPELVDALGQQLAQLKGTQPLMANPRFVHRLHNVLGEWLIGLFDGTFGDEYVQQRWAFGQKLVEIDLRFEDVILLGGLAREQLLEFARTKLGKRPQLLSSTMRTLDKALNLDLALIYGAYLEVHDAEMERTLLDRFLTVTGFSRTLYENLAGTRGWSREGQYQASR